MPNLRFYLLILISLPKMSLGQDLIHDNGNNSRFYNFNIVIDCKSSITEDDSYRIIICNDDFYFKKNFKGYFNLKPKTLYFISSNIENVRNNTTSDTTETKLLDFQLDSIYLLTKNLFRLDNKPNLAEENYVLPFYYDGITATVYFDLCSRGDSFMIELRLAEIDKNFTKLFDYISEISNGR